MFNFSFSFSVSLLLQNFNLLIAVEQRWWVAAERQRRQQQLINYCNLQSEFDAVNCSWKYKRLQTGKLFAWNKNYAVKVVKMCIRLKVKYIYIFFFAVERKTIWFFIVRKCWWKKKKKKKEKRKSFLVAGERLF